MLRQCGACAILHAERQTAPVLFHRLAFYGPCRHSLGPLVP